MHELGIHQPDFYCPLLWLPRCLKIKFTQIIALFVTCTCAMINSSKNTVRTCCSKYGLLVLLHTHLLLFLGLPTYLFSKYMYWDNYSMYEFFSLTDLTIHAGNSSGRLHGNSFQSHSTTARYIRVNDGNRYMYEYSVWQISGRVQNIWFSQHFEINTLAWMPIKPLQQKVKSVHKQHKPTIGFGFPG